MRSEEEFLDSMILTMERAVLQQHFDAVERACEAAVQTGICGVLIDGDKISVDGRVPYGHIYDATACGADNVDWSAV